MMKKVKACTTRSDGIKQNDESFLNRKGLMVYDTKNQCLEALK